MLAGRVAPASVLVDVGAGTGVGAEEAVRLAPRGTYRRSVLLDPQVDMLRGRPRAPTAADRPDAVVADGAALPLADGSVDVLLSLGVLCCMAEEAVPRAVRETYRVLRPGGLAVVAVPKRRGDQDDPLFRELGFERLACLRPGRSLYQRPPARVASPGA